MYCKILPSYREIYSHHKWAKSVLCSLIEISTSKKENKFLMLLQASPNFDNWHYKRVSLFLCFVYPYLKVTGSVCVCLPKDLANLWTEMALLYNIAYHRSWKGLKIFWGSLLPPPLPPNFFTFKTKVKKLVWFQPPQRQVPKKASRGVAASF